VGSASKDTKIASDFADANQEIPNIIPPPVKEETFRNERLL
jgi:hypothetical protein